MVSGSGSFAAFRPRVARDAICFRGGRRARVWGMRVEVNP